MHCQTERTPIPLKDTSRETFRNSLMEVPDLPKKNHQTNNSSPERSPTKESEKKMHQEIVPHENDILLGRGGKNNMHTGNEKLRELAREVAQQYHHSSKKEKSYLSRTLVQKVKEMDPPGRFLRRHPKENHWEDMTEDEDKCREKCAQVLRDAVAFVGLKEVPAPSMAQREQQLHHNPFSMRRAQMTMHPLMMQQQQQHPTSMQMNPNPFAMSASSSSQIMNHMAARRQQQQQQPFSSFSAFNQQPQVRNPSLSLGTSSFEPISIPTGFTSMQVPGPTMMQQQQQQLGGGGVPAFPGDGSFRAPKRRRRGSNPPLAIGDPFMSSGYGGAVPSLSPGDGLSVAAGAGAGAASFAVGVGDRRFSLATASNSFPAVSDFPQTAAGPRLLSTTAATTLNHRRDSLFGSLSLGAHGSDHSGPSSASFGDFQLFPDDHMITTETAAGNDGDDDDDDLVGDESSSSNNNEYHGGPSTRNDNDEFSSDFY